MSYLDEIKSDAVDGDGGGGTLLMVYAENVKTDPEEGFPEFPYKTLAFKGVLSCGINGEMHDEIKGEIEDNSYVLAESMTVIEMYMQLRRFLLGIAIKHNNPDMFFSFHNMCQQEEMHFAIEATNLIGEAGWNLKDVKPDVGSPITDNGTDGNPN